MTHRDARQPRKLDDPMTITRRRLLQGGLAATAAASMTLPLSGCQGLTAQPDPGKVPAGPLEGTRPNILIFLCDQMRFPPVYESGALKAFRDEHLRLGSVFCWRPSQRVGKRWLAGGWPSFACRRLPSV